MPFHPIKNDALENGKDLFARLQQNQPKLKVLFMSGYTRDVIVHHGVVDEGIHFIQQPFSPNTLSRRVRQTLLL